jgi:hypothetical protein
MRKAQSQVFGYIFAFFVLALLLIFGYRAIFGVGEQVESSRYAEFRAELESDIYTAALQFGSAKRAVYSVPASVSEVCFYSPSPTDSEADDSCSSLSEHQLIKDSVDSRAGKNTFILGELPDAIFLDYVDTGICPLRCFSSERGQLSIFMEGKGNRTLVSSQGS